MVWRKIGRRDGSVPTYEGRERAFLVGLEVRGTRPLLSVEESLDELALLAETAGLEVVGREFQKVNRVDQATFIGRGKAEEISALVDELGAEVVIFDDELSPRHQRELEEIFGEDVKVLDRSALILDIFAQHAHTKEGALQVELAQLEYRLPRLTRRWTHLARQTGGSAGRGGHGGVGLRGPGEMQLEVDRREIRRRIARLKRELESVRAHRARYRARRVQAGMPVVALTGYTNAGKSTLLNALTGAGVYVADRLFATLDPTTRRVELPGGRTILVTDTVGFIQRLPATLIAAFRATLEEIAEADLILIVVDATHPNAFQQVETVEDTLAEIGADRIPTMLALNKMDAAPSGYDLGRWERLYDAVVPISALYKRGLDRLLQAIENELMANATFMRVEIPYRHSKLAALVHRAGTVIHEEHTDRGVYMEVYVPPRVVGALVPFRVRVRRSGR